MDPSVSQFFYHRTCVEALWLWYIMAPTKFTALASTKTVNQRPWLATTNSAVTGPAKMPGIVASVFDTAKVMPAWFGAISAWFDKWPAELQALKPILIDTNLNVGKVWIVNINVSRIKINFT